ncbi:hypothetical protein [Maricaulis sp.]|uniref:hypothetical protein n=1 Tax=Maricaulis sp. TaxID=1486257 RepID=UPI003A935026
MILQAEAGSFPRHIDRILFIAGLVIYTAGQVLLNLGQDFVAAQSPVDFAHWLLLTGALFLIPFVARLPWRNLHLITIPLMLVGIASVVGMCVLDFIFWSLPDGEFERQVAGHLIATPAIWQPFMAIGPNYIFGAGLMLPCLSYWNRSRTGVVLVVAGTAIIALLFHWFNVVGYTALTLGYVLCFDVLRPARTLQPAQETS